LPSSQLERTEVRFCLDANLSYRVVEELPPGLADVIHVSRVAELAATVRGRSDAPDSAVAAWCARNERTLVTCDDDFRARTARTRSLASIGVEVIVFAFELSGLPAQIEVMARRVPVWQQQLAYRAYEPRVWVQYRKGRLRHQR
jgi:predicted nuclease of predicted toxin-antitoxin system